MDAARDFAFGCLRTAPGLQRTRTTVRDPCAIKQCRPVVNIARRVQQLTHRTDIDITCLIEGEVIPAQRAILAPRLVDDRNVRRDPLLVDNPIERLRRAIGRVGGKVVRLEVKSLLGSLNHRLRRTDLGLTDGSGSFDVNNDAEFDVNEIVVGICKEAGPRIAPVHCAAGSDGETNFGVTLLAAPNAASSRVARYSLVARLAVSATHVLLHSVPGIDRCLLASATMRLASTANPSPPTKPAAMQASTTRSKTRRNMSLSRNRS